MSRWVFVLCILLPPWVGFYFGMGLSFFNLALAFFVSWRTLLPYCPIAFAMLHLGSCSLGLLWTCLALSFYSVHVAQYYCWVCSHTILGILGPLHSFGHLRLILILHSHGILLNLSSFPGPITISFTFRVYWPFYQPHLQILSFGLLWPIFAYFPFLIIPMSLLFLSLGSLKPACFLWGFLTIL